MPRRIKALLKAKGVQPETSKVYLIKWLMSMCVCIYIYIYIYIYIGLLLYILILINVRLKGLVHPKMLLKMMSLITHPDVVPNP